MTLNIETKTIHVVGYSDFEQWVEKIYSREPGSFSVQAALEAGNDTDHTFNGIDGSFKWLDSAYHTKKWDLWKAGEHFEDHSIISHILHEQVQMSTIPAGDYLIRLSY